MTTFEFDVVLCMHLSQLFVHPIMRLVALKASHQMVYTTVTNIALFCFLFIENKVIVKIQAWSYTAGTFVFLGQFFLLPIKLPKDAIIGTFGLGFFFVCLRDILIWVIIDNFC